MSKAKKKTIKNQEGDIFLTDTQVLNIELLLERKKNRVLELKLIDGSIREALMKVDILKYSIDKKNQNIVRTKSEKQTKYQQYEQADKEYKELIKVIAKKYKITDTDWGFNPDTGKVIISNNK